MATTVTRANAVSLGPRKASVLATWVLANNESGQILNAIGFNDKSIHVYGTFGGATVTMKGGNVNDATKFETLKDFDGTNLTFTAAGINSTRDNVGFMQPVISGGDGTTALTIVILME